jgi:hypothetical protein
MPKHPRSNSPRFGPTKVETALMTAKSLARSLDNIRAIDYGVVYENDKATKRMGVRFHMNRKLRLSKLSADQRLPNVIQGVEVDVLGVGYTPHVGSPRAPHDPLQPGISIGSRKQLTTGTLGPIVRDLSTQNLCLLSNWHVLCGGPEARPNDEITQPGPMDFQNAPTVALLDRWLRLGEQFDAALARLSPGGHTEELLFDTTFKPVATKAPAIGMRLVKSGAVSGVTQAMIDGVSGSYRLDYTSYGDGPQWMQGFRLVPDPALPPGVISLPGDSGSLWIDSADGVAVGLHFAGEDDVSPLNNYALAHPIQDVFVRLNVALAPSLGP